MSRSKKISHVYNPDNQSKQELLDNFVVRLPVFDKLFRSIKNSKMDDAEQHFLIQGQRGTGKTTLLLKLAHEIENDPALTEWLIPVRLNEEQYNIFSLCRLWESVAAQLEDRPGFEDLLDIFEKSFEEKDYPANCYRILEKRLQRENKKLLLLIDNIVDVLKKIGEKECRQLRDILHTTTEIRIIAASARTLEHSFSHDKPFFEFFKIIYLDGLNQKETETLLLKLAENYQKPQMREIIEKHPSRVETLRRLTGGIPRTIILLFEIFVDDSANVFEDLELILDRITPLYKHRMDDLSSQQQAIMDAIALNWDAIATKEIAKKVRMDSKAVASQLKILENSSLIHSIAADRKNKLYQITERFFNIWYLMRYGRKKSREQIRFLVRFLEEWCSQEELSARITKHIAMAKDNGLHTKGAYYMCEALAQCTPSSKLQHELINSTRNYLAGASPELAEHLSPSDKELVTEAFALAYEKKDLPAAIHKLQGINRPDSDLLNLLGVFWVELAENPDQAEKYFRMAVKKGHAGAMLNLANLLRTEHKDLEEVEKLYRMAAEDGQSDAMNNLANLLWEERKDLDGAEKFYRMAVEKGDVTAMNNLASLLWGERKDLDGAEKLYRMAVEEGDADAMNNLAGLLWEDREDLDDAENFFRMAVKDGHACAMYSLANLLRTERKDLEGAEKLYRMAIEKGDTDAMHNLATLLWKERKDLGGADKFYRMAVEEGDADAMHNLALLLWNERKDLDGAEKFLRMAVEKGDADAMQNLALLLWNERKDFDEAEKFYRMAVEKGHTDAMCNLANLREERKDFDGAEKFYRMAVEHGNADAMNGLAWSFFIIKKEKDEALRLVTKAVEQSPNILNTHTLAVCQLWNDAYGQSLQTFKQFLEFDPFENHGKDITLYLVFLLAKKQHHLLLELFEDERYLLKERYKPIYYALMQRMRDEYPKEYKKMGEELRQTVEEILAEADKMAKDYAV